MQLARPFVALLLAAQAAATAATAVAASPLEKVMQLLSDQASKLTKEGEEAKKVYEEYAKWCNGRSKELEFEIANGESDVNEQQATIDSTTAVITTLTSKVEQLTAAIASQEAELKEATEVRAKDAADFAAEEKELMGIIDMLSRAIGIIEREARKNGGALMQLQGANDFVSALEVMVQASVFSSADADRLMVLLQNARSAQGAEDEDGDLTFGAPSAAAYESHSDGLVQTLRDMQDKAENQLQEARKRETKNLHAFEMTKQALEDQTRLANKELDEAKKSIAQNGEKRSAAQGALAAASKELASDKKGLEDLQHECMSRAQDYEAEVKGREDELKVIAEAKKIIAETTGNAAGATYDLNQVSLLQLQSRSKSRSADLGAQVGVVRQIRALAKKTRSEALVQLAGRLETAVTTATELGADPFGKVKGLISQMIGKLEAEAEADATQKAFCDKEMRETQTKLDGKNTEADKLSTTIAQVTARSAQLKEEIAMLQSSLAELASSQSAMDKLRQEEHKLFLTSKADLEQGLEGVKRALKVLRDFYGVGDKAAGGPGSSIIGLLEVVESDFSKGLAETLASEEAAQAAYNQQTNDNEVEKNGKQKDVEYKTKESAELDKTASEAHADLSTVENELTAIHEYFDKLKDQCIAKPESYEERRLRRETEIAGLKQALEVLGGDDAMLLQRSTHRSLRGVRRHKQA